MTFGRPAGPPATARQVQRLTALVVAAGHRDLRDARGPLGLTQRQAGGRFTRDEADELIDRLERAGADDGRDTSPEALPVVDRRAATHARRLRTVPSELLAAELQRRGWIVVEP